MYKITATIKKPGGLDVQWLRFSKVKLTMSECEKLLFKPKQAGCSGQLILATALDCM
ncbi:DUF1187 family protein [Symbiopectobacterium sp. Eva_TO]